MSVTKAQLIGNAPLGSASAPTFTFADDPNTGIYSPGADQIALVTGGTARITIDSSGNVTIANRINVPLGSASAPSIYFAGDTNTGIWSPTGDTIALSTGGSERLRLDSSGRLGLGTSVPDSLLEVRDSSATGIISRSTNTQSTNTNKALKVRNNSDTDTFSVSYKGQGYFADSLGIGTTSPQTKLEVSDNSTTEIEVARFRTNGNTNNPMIRFLVDETANLRRIDATGSITGALAFNQGSNERMRIDNSGRLLVGTSSAVTGSNTQYGKLQILGNTAGSTSDGRVIIGRGESVTSSGAGIGQICFTDSTAGEFANIKCQSDAASGSNDYPGRLVFSTTADGASSPTERMRIQQDGKVVIYNSNAIAPNTDNAVQLGGSGVRFSEVWAANGTIQTSDQRTKTQITDAALGSDFIKALRPVSYQWIEGGKGPTGEVDADNNWIYESVPGKRTHWGFIAQEVKQAVDAAGVDFGGWILTDKNDPDSQQALRYDQFIAPLTKALQETMAELEALKTEVAALKAQ